MRLIVAIVIVALCEIGQSGVRAGKTATGISYDVQGAGPVVVLVTGSNLDRRMWARETGWLARGHTVVRYDLRAHGQSDRATAPFSHLGDLVDVLDTLKISKAALVGLSAGSTIALDAALEHPSRRADRALGPEHQRVRVERTPRILRGPDDGIAGA